MKQNGRRYYLSPKIEASYVEVEVGFAESLLEDPTENPEIDW